MATQVKEFSIDYTDCQFVAPNTTFDSLPSSAYSYHVDSSSSAPTVAAPQWQFTHDAADTNASTANLCTLQFNLPVEMKKPVFMYYKRASGAAGERGLDSTADIHLQG
mgnify:CR=1 FL=1